MLTEEQKVKAREIVGGFDEGKRKAFLEKYNSLDQSKKEVVVGRLLGTDLAKPSEPSVGTGFQPQRALTGYPELKSRNLGQDVAGYVEGRTFGIPRQIIEAGAPAGLLGMVGKAYAMSQGKDKLELPRGSQEARVVGNVIGGAKAIGDVAKAGVELSKGVMNLGGKKAIRKIAIDANRDLIRARNQFGREYDQVLKPVAKNPVQPTEFKSAIDEAKDLVAKGTPAYQYISKFEKQIQGATVKQLHNLKQRLFKQARSLPEAEKNAVMSLYGKANEYLEKTVGQTYTNLNTNFSNFMNNEATLIGKKIMQKVGNRFMITEERLAKKGLKGFGLPGQLDTNSKRAFELLAKRDTSLTNVLKELEMVRRGDIAKRVGLTAGTALAGYIFPPTRKIASKAIDVLT